MPLRHNCFTSALLLSLLLLSSCGGAQERWYKGNLHTHSYWSDGDEFPEMIMEWYKDHGYHFLALSDHNIIAEGEKWKKIPEGEIYQEAFKTYLSKYGADWVEYRKEDSAIYARLKTLKEFRPLFEKPGEFLIFKAEEVTSYLGDKAVHMGAVNLQEKIEPRDGETIVELIQNNLDAIREQAKRTGKPILQHLNHPNFTYAISAKDIIQVDGERFFEVFNGHPYVNNYGDSTHISTEEMWDEVNMAYISAGKPLLYGLATDDSHHYHKFGAKFSNAGRGWVEVKADTLSPSAIIRNLEAGNFYSTTGVEMEKVSFSDNTLSLEVKEEPGVEYLIEFIAADKNQLETRVVKSVRGTTGAYAMNGDDLFVRAKITSTKPKENPYQEGDVEVAWIQPYPNSR